MGTYHYHVDLKGNYKEGWNFDRNNNNPMGVSEHGTWVAGIMCAKGNNDTGITGINWKASLIVATTIQYPYESEFLRALNWIVDKNVRVINISLSAFRHECSQPLQDAINRAYNKKTIVVASAGNRNVRIGFYNSDSTYASIPATCYNVITVGAIDTSLRRAVYSNYGRDFVDIMAPGGLGGIKTMTTITQTSTGVSGYNNNFWGTSAATAHVSGIIGLMLTVNPLLTPKEVRDILIQTAIPLSDEQCRGNSENYLIKGIDCGAGLINAFEAVKAAKLKNVLVDQKLEGGINSVDSVGRWEKENIFKNYSVPARFEFEIGSTEILRATRNIIQGQKYNNWNNLPEVNNHKTFKIYSYTSTLTSNLKSISDSIVVSNEIIQDISQNQGLIQFLDPWLVDTTDSRFYDPPYGYRNLGMEAPFMSETSPFKPTLQSKYKGVFLNQTPDQNNPNKPYYSVRVPQSQIIYSKAMCFGFCINETI